VDVILTTFTANAKAAQQATSSIPIVLGYSTDPVGVGLVQSLARPGGNITGLATNLPELSGKQLQLMSQIVPGLSRVAVFVNPSNPGSAPMYSSMVAAGGQLDISITRLEAENENEVERAFQLIDRAGCQAIIVLPDSVFNPPRDLIQKRSNARRLPSSHPFSDFARLGGLMSYGENAYTFLKRSAYFVDKILKGVKPADIPLSRRPRHSGSRSHPRCSPAPTR